MGFFESCRLLYQLSNEYFSVLNGWVVWEKFGFEATMVMTRVSHDIIMVFDKIKGNALIVGKINLHTVVIG